MKKGSPRRNLGNMLEASGLKKSLYVRLELNWAEALEKKPQYCSPSLFLLKRLADPFPRCSLSLSLVKKGMTWFENMTMEPAVAPPTPLAPLFIWKNPKLLCDFSTISKNEKRSKLNYLKNIKESFD